MKENLLLLLKYWIEIIWIFLIYILFIVIIKFTLFFTVKLWFFLDEVILRFYG